MEPFDLILLVMIGDLVQQGVTQNDFSVTGSLLVGATIALMTVVVSYTSFRFPRLRPVLDGEPVIVVEDGKPIDRNLRRNRITLEELAAAARQEGSTRSTPSSGRCWRRTARSASSRSRPRRLRLAALPDRGGRRRPDHRRRGGPGSRRASCGWRRVRSRTCRGGASARRGQLRRHVRGRPRARLRRASRPTRPCSARRFAVSCSTLETGELASRARGGHGRPAADRRGERRRREAPRPPGATTLGVIGCGWQAEAQVEAIRAAVPAVERSSPTAGRRSGSGSSAPGRRRAGRVARGRRRAGRRRHDHDLPRSRPSRRVAARGRARLRGRCANDRSARELDNVVLERASFVCCDSRGARSSSPAT